MSIREAFERQTAQADLAPQAFPYRGEVSSAPATVNDRMGVIVPGINKTTEHLAKWTPRVTAAAPPVVRLPAVGDTCLVHFDDEAEAWVPVYWKANNA